MVPTTLMRKEKLINLNLTKEKIDSLCPTLTDLSRKIFQKVLLIDFFRLIKSD